MSEPMIPSESRLGPSSATKVILEVTAGILPGEPIPDKTKRWALTEHDVANTDAYLKAVGHAQVYALMLQDPGQNNWVKFEWWYL